MLNINYLFIANALVLAFLGASLYWAKRSKLTRVFMLTNLGLASWNVCIFLTEEQFWPEQINLISKVQLLSAMTFVNGFYSLCSSYPMSRTSSGVINPINGAIFLLLSGLILFTDAITRAELVEGVVVYIDNPYGYLVYTLYLSALCVGSLVHLWRSYRRYDEHMKRIQFLFLGISLFVVTAIVCNLVLPLLGIYELLIIGRLSAIFPSLFFSYVIVKHSFLDMTVIINRKMAWLITCLVVVVSYLLTHPIVASLEAGSFAAFVALGLFWAFFAHPLQRFLLTSAKRKFVRGWYNTEEVISSLSKKLTQEKSREAIFRIIEAEVDKVFELEKSLVVVAVRDSDENFVRYEVSGSNPGLTAVDELVEHVVQAHSPLYLDETDAAVGTALMRAGFLPGRRCLIVPFHSPEYLEGIIVLGERSNQLPFTAKDMDFFSYLISYVDPILYRLTPMEQLEQLYFENMQRLHEAEIQLIRAQKIESIVHATRQCHHEIRTPLNIIRLGIGRIKSMDDLAAYKSMAQEEISRALEIVEETLTITDVNKASQDRYSVFNVNEVLNRCYRLIPQNDYEVRLEPGDLSPIWGSFSDIQVAVTNLIHNALDAMPNGGFLRLASRQAGEQVIVEVEDSGGGIPESLRSKVWEPYFSGHETVVGNSSAGRGWGLTIVNRIITEHRGTVNFISEPGVGTRFTITLPAASEKSGDTAVEDELADQRKVS